MPRACFFPLKAFDKRLHAKWSILKHRTGLWCDFYLLYTCIGRFNCCVCHVVIARHGSQLSHLTGSHRPRKRCTHLAALTVPDKHVLGRFLLCVCQAVIQQKFDQTDGCRCAPLVLLTDPFLGIVSRTSLLFFYFLIHVFFLCGFVGGALKSRVLGKLKWRNLRLKNKRWVLVESFELFMIWIFVCTFVNNGWSSL